MEDNKFKLTCLQCNSNDISIKEEISYDYDEMPYITGTYLECNNCGNNDL